MPCVTRTGDLKGDLRQAGENRDGSRLFTLSFADQEISQGPMPLKILILASAIPVSSHHLIARHQPA
jgi:hypothetical protein